MRVETTVSPPNSVVLVMDLSIGVVPESMAGGLISATDSCVAVGTLAEIDGETTFVLSSEQLDISSQDTLVFDGEMPVSSGKMSICTVDERPLLSIEVGGARCRAQIWANDPSEPDRIMVLLVAADDSETAEGGEDPRS